MKQNIVITDCINAKAYLRWKTTAAPLTKPLKNIVHNPTISSLRSKTDNEGLS